MPQDKGRKDKWEEGQTGAREAVDGVFLSFFFSIFFTKRLYDE